MTFTAHTPSAKSPSATTSSPRHVVLVPGFWLGGWAWDDVAPRLALAGLVPHPVTLPGLAGPDDRRDGIVLEDHVRTVTDLVDSLDGDVVLVGHSGGAVVVQSVVDRRPDRVRRVVYVDSGPMVDGLVLFPGLPDGVVEVAFPSDDELTAQQLSTDGLDGAALAELRRRSVPHPAGVMGAPVQLTDERRLRVPVTAICTSLPSAVLQQLTEAGQIPSEMPRYEDVETVDLPTGHWPMLSRPTDLADALVEAARR